MTYIDIDSNEKTKIPSIKAKKNTLKFGDEWENLYAGERNPHRIGYFVEMIYRKGKVNGGKHYRFTDKKGEFWMICDRIFDEVEQMRIKEKENE